MRTMASPAGGDTPVALLPADGEAPASLSAAVSREVGKAGRYLGQAFRLMVGLPDYDNYLTHMEATHPGVAPMSYEEFFRDRQGARYGAGRGSCC